MIRSEKLGFPEGVREVFEALWQQVARLHAKWLLYKELFADEQDLAILNETAPAAFSLIEESLRSDLAITFRRLTEPAPPEGELLSLTVLVRDLEPCCPPAVYASFQDRLDKVREHVKPLVELCERLYARADLRTALDTHPEPLPRIGRTYLDEATRLIAELMNDIDSHFNDHVTAFDHPIQIGTGKSLLLHLRRSLQELSHVLYDEKFSSMSDLRLLLESANRELTAILGPSARRIVATWELGEDSEGRPLLTLTIRDDLGQASVKLTPEELRNPSLLRQRFRRLWGDLLQMRSESLLEHLLAGQGGGDDAQ